MRRWLGMLRVANRMLNHLIRAKWLLGGNIIYALNQWLILTLIARELSTKDLGLYTYAISIAGPIFILMNMQLRPIYIAEFNSSNKYSFESFFSLRLYTNILGIVIGIAWATYTNIETLPIVICILIIKALEGFSDIIYSKYNAHNKTELITKSLLIKSVSALLAVIICIYSTKSLLLSIISIILTYVLVLTFVDFNNLKLKPNWFVFNLSEFSSIIVYAIPLAIASTLISLTSNMPRYFLEDYFSLDLVGIYSVFIYFVAIGNIFINSVCQYFSPYFSIYWNSNNKLFLKTISYCWMIAIIFGLIMVLLTYLFGKELLNIIYGSKFNNYIYELKIIILSSIFTYASVVNGYVLTAIKVLKTQVPIFLFILSSCVILSYFLIPKYGLTGAAWGTLAVSLIQFLITISILLNKLRVGYVKT